MKLRKDIGYWIADDSTYLDDVAYTLMCDNIEKNHINHINQLFFIHHKEYFPYFKYYKEAKNILRKEKIDKICQKNQY